MLKGMFHENVIHGVVSEWQRASQIHDIVNAASPPSIDIDPVGQNPRPAGPVQIYVADTSQPTMLPDLKGIQPIVPTHQQ
jgi:hypothetical protein